MDLRKLGTCTCVSIYGAGVIFKDAGYFYVMTCQVLTGADLHDMYNVSLINRF